jgi:hypothetical protein
MTEQHIYSRKCKPTVGVGIVGFGLATFCQLGGAATQGCNLLSSTAWAALEVLRSVIVLASWHAMSAYLCEDSGALQHLLRLVASIWPLFCVVVSWVK